MERQSFLSILQSRGSINNRRYEQTSPSALADRVTKYLDPARIANAKSWPVVELQIRATELVAPVQKTRIKAYNLSDMHADAKDNQEWVRVNCVRVPEDTDVFTVFIVPGDIGSEIKSIRCIFEMLVAQFDAVIYVPGNHEAWCKGAGGNGSETGATNSVLKLSEVICLAESCGVYTGPLRVCTAHGDGDRALCVYPLYSWYHAGWDTEPIPQHPAWVAVEAVLPFAKKWSDFGMCHWPAAVVDPAEWATTAVPPETADSTVLAEMFASLNEPFLHHEAPLTASRLGPHAPLVQPGDTVIAFSHFLPREELLPEKRFVMEPLLSRVVGSDVLEAQVRRLSPHLHLFGHTHIPIDLELEGVRYVQWPLGYSREAAMQCQVVRAEGSLLCYDSALGAGKDGIPEMPRSANASWSAYYRSHAREAHVVGPLAPWVLERLRQYDDVVKKATAPIPVTIPADTVFNAATTQSTQQQRAPLSPKSPLLLFRGVKSGDGNGSKAASPAAASSAGGSTVTSPSPLSPNTSTFLDRR